MNIYDCTCGRQIDPAETVSRCESHRIPVGPCCEPCEDCWMDRAEERSLDEWLERGAA